MEVLARHRHPRSRHPHPRLGAQKVRTVSSALIGPNILSELSAPSPKGHIEDFELVLAFKDVTPDL